MLNNPDFVTARDILLGAVKAVGTESVALEDCAGRVLGEDIEAAENVPGFDRSPYDGYAFRSADSVGASKEHPITLRIVEEVPAGAVSQIPCTEGTAVKILTGAPLPEGADCVIMHEKTAFNDKNVKIFETMKAGSNIVFAGSDIRRGDILARKGQLIDAGTAGTLASQGIACPKVYRRPKVAVISTGNEVVEVGTETEAGKIFNSNRYMLTAALESLGCEVVYLGISSDRPEDIAGSVEHGLEHCDAVISTGGVSAGDYDFTPAAMELAGVRMLFRGVELKPGMACAYGEKNGKIVCGLSGNPASALTNFHAVAAPPLKKLAGRSDCMPEIIKFRLKTDFKKKSPKTRLLRGKLDLSGGTIGIVLQGDQGNAVLISAIGCNAMAIVPAGSGPLKAGTILEGFLI
ncbi:MAG: molybdopterin molybdotransferase MoeA [Oscillospiraceae bacterium]|nr:molybdopterin molybdotransferase MoeA [Oscillospiraceae bacterium]